MKRKFLPFIAVFLLLASCSTLKTTTTKTLDIYGAGVIQMPVIADLDVSETRVTGQATGSSSSIEDIKNDAIANALETANADVLVEPRFITETSKGSGKSTIKVTGYPATYKNFRSVVEEDLILIEAGVMQYPEEKTATVKVKKKK